MLNFQIPEIISNTKMLIRVSKQQAFLVGISLQGIALILQKRLRMNIT